MACIQERILLSDQIVKRVLLTGATGFIGHHSLEPLKERGYEIHAISSRSDLTSANDVKWHQFDLLKGGSARDLIASIQPTHLLHLAWYVVPGKLISSPENFAWVHSSFELVRAFAEQGGKRAVTCGSGYEYDWNYGYCSEKLTPTVPNTIYGSCKHALHELIRSYAPTSGLSSAWGRVFFLYGPHEHPDRLVSSVIRSLLAGNPARCSHGRQIRDYMHVQDIADGLVALLDSSIEGAVNVSSGQATTLREIVLTIGRLTGRPELIQLGAIPARANDTPLVVGEAARMTSETDWTQKFDIESGLRQTIDWWAKQPPQKEN
jgi:nucleoside-diphosphate-sugar epimerase